jgi:hypothetical protein
MTNQQLYLAIGLPIIVNILFNGMMFLFLKGDVRDLRTDIRILIGKVADMDTEIGRVKERLGMK